MSLDLDGHILLREAGEGDHAKHGGGGRRWYNAKVRAPAKTFVSARRLRREMTLPEVLLWKALRGSAMNGVRFRRQHSVGPYVLDFYAPAAKLVIEVDGAAHDIVSVAARDARRDDWLRARGLKVLRFNAIDALDPKRRINVLETIAAVLAELGAG